MTATSWGLFFDWQLASRDLFLDWQLASWPEGFLLVVLDLTAIVAIQWLINVVHSAYCDDGGISLQSKF